MVKIGLTGIAPNDRDKSVGRAEYHRQVVSHLKMGAWNDGAEIFHQMLRSRALPPADSPKWHQKSEVCLSNATALLTMLIEMIDPAVYDTPQSFLFGRSHHNKRETEIPDSPTRRKASFTRIPDEPKSESPEPRASIYETPPEDENRRPKSRARIIASEHKFPETEPPSDSLDASASAEHSRNEFHFSSPAARAHHALGTRQDTIIPILNRSSLEVQRHSNAASGSRKPMAQEVFDPIETDSDNFDGKQRMYQPKPLRLSRTPNSRGATSGPLQLQDAAVDQPNESNSSPNYTAFNPEEIHELCEFLPRQPILPSHKIFQWLSSFHSDCGAERDRQGISA